jgi:hypothetical protein
MWGTNKILKIEDQNITIIKEDPIGEFYFNRFYKFYEGDIIEAHKGEVKINKKVLEDSSYRFFSNPWIPKTDIFYYDSIYDKQRNAIKKRHAKDKQ